MTYEYTLADKLRNQFSGRGAALNGMQASSTSELMRRAEKGRNPDVNCAQQAFREQYVRRQGNGRSNSSAYSNTDPMHTSVYSTVSTGRQSAGQRRGGNTTQHKQSGNVKRSQSTHNKRSGAGRMEPIVPSLEMPVKKKFLPPVFIAMLLVSTLMIMFLVMSISEIYETTNEISTLKNQISELKSSAEDLQLQLEEKNDIRLIEEIATTQLGMTKEDSLQRRYVSLSDGEHIDILEVEEEKEEGVFLSSILSALSGVFGGR